MYYLCKIKDIPEGEGRAFEIKKPDDKVLQVLVVKMHGDFFAYQNACAHFGVRLDVVPGYKFVVDGEIVCQVHYARYDITSGSCIRGDCDNEGLRPLKLKISETDVFLLL